MSKLRNRLLLFLSSSAAGTLGAWLYPGKSEVSTIASFCMGACFVLSIIRQAKIYIDSFNDRGNWLESQCDSWRFIKRGVLFYSNRASSPVVFMPWKSIKLSEIHQDDVYLEDEENDTFYHLPMPPEQHQEARKHIHEQIEQHKHLHREEEDFSRSVFFMHSPYKASIRPFIPLSLLWLTAGCISPFIPGMEAVQCITCFCLATALSANAFIELKESFCQASYFGEELRRSKRGIIIRMNGSGITSFLPWSSMEECIGLPEKEVFLRLKGREDGICCCGHGVPLPVTRRYRWWQRLRGNIWWQSGLILLSSLLGIIWWELCTHQLLCR